MGACLLLGRSNFASIRSFGGDEMSEIVSERVETQDERRRRKRIAKTIRRNKRRREMRKCPICDKTAWIEKESRYGEMFCRKSEKYYVRCECEIIRLRGKNKPDLEASWNRWARMVSGIKK